jgi:NADH-ubiquinone oxidoreductase chain 5
MYLLPMWFSAYSFLVLAVFGRHVGGKGASISATARITVGFLTSIYIFYEVCICRTVCYLTCLDRVNIELVNVHRGFVFDPLSASMLLVINMISSCAHIYSVEYMSAEPHRIRSISYPSPLTSLMPFLVLSDNALQLFVGREGVGICSYLLINF